MLYDDETNPQERDGGAQQRASTRLDPRSLAGNWWFTHYTVDTETGFSSDVMWRLRGLLVSQQWLSIWESFTLQKTHGNI